MTAPTYEELTRDVQGVLDREALRDLNVRYAMAIDDRRISDIGACFTADGTLGHVDAGVSGRDTIEAFYAARLANYGPTYHYPHAFLFELDGDTARGTVLAHAELGIDGQTYQVAIRYVDEYRREDEWRIRERGIRNLYFAPVAELPRIFEDELRIRWPGEPRPADLPEGDPAWVAFNARRG